MLSFRSEEACSKGEHGKTVALSPDQFKCAPPVIAVEMKTY